MAVKLPNGIIFSLATKYSVEHAVSAISNQNPAVVTAAGHQLANGEIIEFKSSWSALNDRAFRVAQVSDDDSYTLDGTDTTNPTRFPAGGGTGAFRTITGWQQLQQVTECTTSGGEMQFATYSFLENDFESQIPTQASAQSLQLSIADDPSLPGYKALKEAAESREIRVLRALLPDNSIILFNGYTSFNETPVMTKGSVMTVSATFSLLSRPIRYEA